MAGPANTSGRKKSAPKIAARDKVPGPLREDQPTLKRHAAAVVRLLRRHYPDAMCSLDFHTPLELLVATILSAQCTDVRVNLVTPELFRKYRSAADYARAPIAELEQEIQSTGFYHSKAKGIQNCCRLLVENYGGQPPQDIDQLV